MTDIQTRGTHHIGLTVPDLEAARDFFTEVLGFAVVGEVPDYPAVFVSDGTITLTLWRVADPQNVRPFDRRTNIGLHHLALAVADEAALHAAFDRVVAWPGVIIESRPGPVRPGSPTRHFLFAMPGGIRIELATLSA
jgi:catechol 2,3-dioxygenase-like lactoylglutathione lyase family enzyme